jgi:hypothetical protein
MVKAVCLLAAALLLISSGAAYSRSQASATTLVWANGRIAAFAQDGDQIAWASLAEHAACPRQVRIRLLAAKKQRVVTKLGGPTCRSETDIGTGVSGDENLFVLAGERALWARAGFKETEVFYEDLISASYAGARDVRLDTLEHDRNWGDGDHLSGISGDSSTLVYGIVKVDVDLANCDVDTEDCTASISSGGVKRVTGAHEVAIPDAPPPFMLAASGHRIAVVVAETAFVNGKIGPGSPATVMVKDAVSGADFGSFSPAGTPLAIAFAPSVVAVLESTDGERQIEFHTPTGALVRTVTVPAQAKALSTTNKRAVFRVGNSIRSVRVAAGSIQTIGTSAATPIGLSIEGTRVAWAENVKVHGVLRGRIVKVTVR